MNASKSLAKLKFDPSVRNKLRDLALGPAYDLSFAFVGPPQMRALNRHYRGQDKTTNILSFPLTKDSGEIVIDKALATREARAQGQLVAQYLVYLFIHGLLHLKGMTHGSKMDHKERQLAKTFYSLYGQNSSYRFRHRQRLHSLGGL